MNKKWLLVLIGVTLIAAFYPAFVWMKERFLEANSYYSHGFLVPLISLFLVWKKREVLASLPETSSIYGLVMVCVGFTVYIVAGVTFHIGFISGLSFITVLAGLVLYLYGKAITRAVLFPLCFLLFMVPVPQVALLALSFKLKMMATYAAVTILSLFPLSLVQHGNSIYIPNGVVRVDGECSGISSLISIFMMSVLFAFGMAARFRTRAAFVLASLPIAVIANITRIMLLTLIAYAFGTAAATQGLVHFGAGIALWAVALLFLFMEWKWFVWYF